MKLKALILLLGILCPIATFSQQRMIQLSEGGIPWSYKFSQFDNEIPVMDMGLVDVNALAQEDAINDLEKNAPWRFGVEHFTSYNLNNSGVWKTLDNGDRIWRIGFSCPGASSVNLAFQYVSIPEGAKLFIYNEDKSISLGAFTQSHISPDLKFATEVLEGENIFVEYYVPSTCQNVGSMEIFKVIHGYRSPLIYAERAFGGSGSCENNVNCFPAYSNNKRSVVMLIIGGGLCSGSLINNTCNDGTPYVLTANHCTTIDGTTVYRFNWEAPTCSQPGSSPPYVSITGGVERAVYGFSDLSLTQITSAIPASYGVYFSGWDRTNTGAVNPYGIHHPAGDIKKISFSTGTATGVSITFNTFANTEMWQTPTWTDGVTEGGSSGSPLFNSSGQIVGQLGGGPSACAYENDPVNGFDYYGKLYRSWTGGGTAATRVSDWLAPSGCGAAPTSLVGYDPNSPTFTYDAQLQSITAPTGTLCTGSTTPVVVIRNNGTTTLTQLTINYQIDGGATTAVPWTGSLASTASVSFNMPAIVVAAGAHTYTATIVSTTLNGSNTDLNTANNASTSNYTGLVPTSTALPLAYGFEPTAMPPTTPSAWTLTNGLAGSITFARTTAAFSLGAASTWLNYFADNTGQGTTDDLIMPYLDFSGVGTPATMTFDVAHRRYSATYIDSLRVLVSTNCGTSWTSVYSKGGSVLATVSGDLTTTFTPTAGQWRNESINLNAYAGMNNVLIKFQGYSGYGQNIYVDNINITGSVASPPTASFTTTGNTICAGQTVTYTSTSTGSPTSIAWTFPGGSPASGTTSPITVTYAAAGTYTTTLTATNGGGSNTTTQTVTVNANPTNTASNTGPYCSGATIQLNATAGAVDYDWVGPNSYVQNNTQNPNILSSTTLMGGVYTVTVTNASGCTATATTAVTVNATPTANATNGGPYCVGTTIQLNSVGGGATDDWAGPSYTQNNTQNPTRTNCTLAMAGVYTVTVTSGSCSSTSTTTVVVNSNPTAAAANTGPYCSGTSIQLNSVGGSATDDWAGPLSYSQTNTQNPIIPFSTVGMAGVYTVTVTNGAGCTATGTTTVTVNPTPTPTATNSGPYCPGSTIQLNSVGGSATDDWAGPNSYVQTNMQNPTIPGATLAMDGVYTVTATAGSCSSTSTTTVVVVNTSSATATNTGAYCVGATIDLNTIAGGTGYAWTGPNSYSASSQNPSIPSSTLSMAGVYSVTVTFAGGCTSSATTTVVVNNNPSAPVITPGGATTFCSGNSVTLTSSYASGNVWSTSAVTAGITVNSTGTYTVTYTDLNGCTSTASQAVTVNPLPTVNQSSLGTVCVTYSPVTLTGGTPAGGVYSGTAVSGGLFDPALAGTGTFTITYTYTDGNGCTNTANNSIQVLPCAGVEGNSSTVITIYPNPTEQYVNITGLENGLHDFAIINTLGQTIKVGKLYGDGMIDLGIVASGTYYLKIDQQFWKIIRK